MVSFNQAKTHDEQRKIFEEMTQFQQSAVYKMQADMYRFYEKWYHSAVWALFDLIESDGSDAKELCKLIVPKITPSQFSHSVELLMKLGLLEITGNGILKQPKKLVDTGTRPPKVAVNHFIMENVGYGERIFGEISFRRA